MVKDKQRIYSQESQDITLPIVIGLLSNSIDNLEDLICQPIIPTIIKATLYDLMAGLVSMKMPMILENILRSKLLNYVIIDYDKYDDNSNILILLNKVVFLVLRCKEDGMKLRHKLLIELNLLKIFSEKLQNEEYKVGQARRKCIYPFIHKVTDELIKISLDDDDLRKQLQSAELSQYWDIMLSFLEENEKQFQIEWGTMTDIKVEPNDTSKDVYRRHEAEKSTDFKLLSSDGAASTTKKIRENSMASMKKMAGFDPVLN